MTSAGLSGIAVNTTYVSNIGIASLSVDYQLVATIEPEMGHKVAERKGTYPYLTSEELARIFPILAEHMGSLPIIPIQGVYYNKYVFEVTHDAYALEGMNHMDKYKEVLEVYVAVTGSNVSVEGSNLSPGDVVCLNAGEYWKLQFYSNKLI